MSRCTTSQGPLHSSSSALVCRAGRDRAGQSPAFPLHQSSLPWRSAARGDRLKILVWDGTGMVLTYKILEQGSFAWPKVQDGTMRLSRGQFEALFEGLDWRRVVAQRVAPPTAAG
ncbi:IS66 family insertion sequence element accessory protein TnpB [Mesorhizobium sp.]|uniref:IS66 family insertion sequence element accessory protein TnpB n=1 Tax=Mesorhizobium sp. TaxID=1871066 RepID=UPI0025B8B00F|nr:IS66 family insertion sequence element accessory protein TnpB [Mesorhizobium sp.]